MEKTQKDSDLSLLERHTKQLMEHFDSVHIFCTRHDGTEGTLNADYGNGNWYARYGQIELWIQNQTLIREKEELL